MVKKVAPLAKFLKLHSPVRLITVGILTLLLGVSVVLASTSFGSGLGGRSPGLGLATPTASAPAANVPPGSSSPSVRLVAYDLTPSSRLQVAAAGFVSKEQLALTVVDAEGHTYDVGTVAAGADGRVQTASLAPPTGLASGTYQLVVVGSTSHRRASAPFRMHDTPPTVALDTYTGTPGQSIGFAGKGFFNGEEVNVYLGPSKTSLASVKSSDVGTITGKLTVPALSAGTYTMTVIGKQSQSPATVGFNVQGYSAWVILSRYALMPGQTVGFIGNGFAPGEHVFVYLNSTEGDPVMRVQADTSGRVVVQDTWVPAGSPGENEVILVGQSSKVTATARFTILPGPEPTAQPTPTTTAP